MESVNVMTILVNHRSKNVTEFQNVLTKFGCLIKVRLGLHEAGNICSEEGLIILQLTGSQDEISDFETSLNVLTGVTAKNNLVKSQE